MKYIELSIKSVKEESNKLYKKTIQNYEYDLVIFIARGAYLIGEELSRLNNVPLLEIYATRKGGKLKKIIKPLLKYIPKNISIKLRKKEMKSSYHEKNNERKIYFDEKKFLKYKSCKKILLVDDSIDSGNSIMSSLFALRNFFSKSEIKVAVFNEMKKSSVKGDFILYEDYMICGPWSNDSNENKVYMKMYNDWKEKYDKAN